MIIIFAVIIVIIINTVATVLLFLITSSLSSSSSSSSSSAAAAAVAAASSSSSAAAAASSFSLSYVKGSMVFAELHKVQNLSLGLRANPARKMTTTHLHFQAIKLLVWCESVKWLLSYSVCNFKVWGGQTDRENTRLYTVIIQIHFRNKFWAVWSWNIKNDYMDL